MKRKVAIAIILLLAVVVSVKLYHWINKDKMIAELEGQRIYNNSLNLVAAEKIIKLDKFHYEANVTLAKFNQTPGNIDARQELREALHGNEKKAKRLAIQKNEYLTLANQYLNQLLKIDTLSSISRSQILSNIGYNLLCMKKDLKDNYFQKALELDATNYFAYYGLAETKGRNNQEVYNKYIEKFLKAITDDESLIPSFVGSPGTSYLFQRIGYNLIINGENKLAWQIAKLWKKLQPDDTNSDDFLRFAGYAAYYNKLYPSSATLFSAYIKSLEDIPVGYTRSDEENYELAEIYYYAGMSYYYQGGFKYINAYKSLKKSYDLGYEDAEEPYEYLQECGYNEQLLDDYNTLQNLMD